MEKEVPEGKVVTVSGEIIDRADACYLMKQDSEHKYLWYDVTGRVYFKDDKGTLRRLSPKNKKKLKQVN